MVFKTYGGLDPVNDAEIIVNRQELNIICNHIKNRDDYVTTNSPNQTGKTTLLLQIKNHFENKDYGIVYLDLSNFKTLNKEEFYQKICIESNNQLTQSIRCDQEHDFQQIVDQFRFSEYLKWLASHTPQVSKIIFLIDELNGIPEEISPIFFATLRKFFTAGRGVSNDNDENELYKKIMFVFAASLDLHKLSEGQNSPLSNVCIKYWLNDFSERQVLELARNLQKLSWSEEKIIEIAKFAYYWSSGHPYLTQRILSLVEESQECLNASANDMPEVMNLIIERELIHGGDANIDYIRDYFRSRDQSYQNSVLQILDLQTKQDIKPLKTLPHDRELILSGIIKRLEDSSICIHNKIYIQVLENFLKL